MENPLVPLLKAVLVAESVLFKPKGNIGHKSSLITDKSIVTFCKHLTLSSWLNRPCSAAEIGEHPFSVTQYLFDRIHLLNNFIDEVCITTISPTVVLTCFAMAWKTVPSGCRMILQVIALFA